MKHKSKRPHIDRVTCMANNLLDFIKRIATELNRRSSLKALFCALVRPIVDEYGWVCCLRPTLSRSTHTERVQREFLNSVGFELIVSRLPHATMSTLFSISWTSDDVWPIDNSLISSPLTSSVGNIYSPSPPFTACELPRALPAAFFPFLRSFKPHRWFEWWTSLLKI